MVTSSPGLAPLTKPEDMLSAQQRACLTVPMREFQARLAKRGNVPAERAGEEFIRLAVSGLLKLERLRRADDGEVDLDLDGPPQFEVTGFKEHP